MIVMRAFIKVDTNIMFMSVIIMINIMIIGGSKKSFLTVILSEVNIIVHSCKGSIVCVCGWAVLVSLIRLSVC